MVPSGTDDSDPARKASDETATSSDEPATGGLSAEELQERLDRLVEELRALGLSEKEIRQHVQRFRAVVIGTR